MLRFLAGLITGLFLITSAFAQSGASVKQSGSSVNPGSVPYWVTNGVIGDSVTSADSPVTSFGVTSAGQLGICDNSARSSASGWTGLCMGFVSGVPTISVQSYGTAGLQPLQFLINGTTFSFGSGGGTSGVVTFSGASTANVFPCWTASAGVLTNCSIAATNLVGNPTSAAANAAAFSIQGLTARGAPDANNDKLLLYDNAAGTLKYVTPGQIAAAATAGVSSLGGVTGAITLGTGLSMAGSQLQNTGLTGPGGTNGQIQYNNAGGLGGFTASGDATINTSSGILTLSTVNSNVGTFNGSCPSVTANAKGLITAISTGLCSTNAQTASYPIATTDCGKIVTFSGGPYTATLPAASGFSAGCRVTICNINANSNGQRAVRLSGFPNPLFARLWMGQCLGVTNIAATSWEASTVPGRWHPAFTPTFTIDTVNGSDANDGQVSNASGNALLTVGACLALLQLELDLSGNIQPICSPTSGQIFQEALSITGPLVGGSVFNITGNGGNPTIKVPASGATILQLNDFAPYMISTNVTWDCTGGAAGCVDINLHQQTGIDLNAGTQLVGGGSGHIGVSCDSKCKINVGASPLTVSGTFNRIISLDQGSVVDFNSGLTLANNTTIAGTLIDAEHSSGFFFYGALIGGTGLSVAEIFSLRSNATGCVQSNFTTSGSFGTARQWSVLNNAFFGNTSPNAVPGSTTGINTSATFAAGVVANSGLNSGGC